MMMSEQDTPKRFRNIFEISKHLTKYAPTPMMMPSERCRTEGEDVVVFNMTPRISCAYPFPPSSTSSKSSSSSRTDAQELVREIAQVEVEIINLERYILSLYRTNFAHHLAAAANIQQLRRTSDSNSENPLPPLQPSLNTSPSSPSASIGSTQEHRMLADHLCASLRDNIFGNPCKLSEDILKSIASVYFKLRSNTAPTVCSPVSSPSASTTFSLRDQSDNWSPRYYYEPTASPSQLERLKAKDGILDMVEITRVVIDKERFRIAVAMLEDHRVLVRRLESVDPSKMDHEEKLCFWINVHNAMVMHAFIAYGLENSQIKSTPTVMKKTYDVGGFHFNAYDIQTSILRLRPHHSHHRSEQTIRSLLPHTRKNKTWSNGNSSHGYGLHRSEPLAHFGLCLGSCSDPSVRVYMTKKNSSSNSMSNVITQLEAAREEFIQTQFHVYKENRIVLPKILDFYTKDALMDFAALFRMLSDSLPENQSKALLQCVQGRRGGGRRIEWASYKSDFRYLLHRDLDFTVKN